MLAEGTGFDPGLEGCRKAVEEKSKRIVLLVLDI